MPTGMRALARLASAVAATAVLVCGPATVAFATAGATGGADIVAAVQTPGAVVGVSGAPFLWVADEQGVLHLVGDTAALDGHVVDWSNASQVSLDQLRSSPIGDPWLSAGLVKMGDAIYVPRKSGSASAPALYHVQSAADLSLMGINGQNYGQLVRDATAWDRQFGLSSATLLRAELPAIVSGAAQPAAPAVPAAPPAPATSPAPAAPAAPAAAAAPAAPAAPAPAASSAAAYASSGLLTHTPRFGSGGDVSFDVPAGHNWNDATSTRLEEIVPLGTLTGEQMIAQWWAFNGTGQVYTLLQVQAIHLATHPEVKTAQDLATLKMRFLCRDVVSCTQSAQPATTVGVAPGVPAAIVDSTMDRQLSGLKKLSGLATDAQDKEAEHILWKMRDVFVVKGNYGYDIRLSQADSDLPADRLAELSQMLATLTFRY
jgi:hypothetical protein